MKTRHVFLAISISMLIIEVLMAYMAFELITDVITQVSLVIMMLVGITITIITYTAYHEEKLENAKIYKGNV